MPSFARVPGVRVENLDQIWAAYSPASGETLLLNDTSAAILEILESHGTLTHARVAELLATDTQHAPEEVTPVLNDCWPGLLQAGLVRDADAG
jgi:PqqD family protein of HPr-rel-A system